jgi:single-stranded-DNA-specific exonuclease
LAFLMRDVPILQVDLVGKGQPAHAKLLLDAGGYRWPGLYWNAANKVGTDFNAGDRVNLVVRLTRSHYAQVETLQLTILDLER